MLALASGGLIIGFNVIVDTGARRLADSKESIFESIRSSTHSSMMLRKL